MRYNKILKGDNLSYLHGTELINLKAEISYLMSLFDEFGASEIELPSLLDASVLVDVYGEDIRNRVYSAFDSFGNKKILRPDFTVPIVQTHIASGSSVGKYSYSGLVWRSQPSGGKKPSEYYQAGLEYFHEVQSARADAEIFELFYRCARGSELNSELGDMGILRAIVNCLDISDNKRNLLLRHLWRPKRFRQLMSQLATGDTLPASRSALFKAIQNEQIEDYIIANGPVIGKRSLKEIVLRATELFKQETRKPISQAIVSMIEMIQSLRCSLGDAPKKLTEFLSLGRELRDVQDNLSSRIQAIAELDIDVSRLNFATSLPKTSLEYYDGFIFTISIQGLPNLPPVAQGGRYNALTGILGKGAHIPAVGGIIRPEILCSLRGKV